MTTTTYTATGMTCDHCVAAVTDELLKVHGVEQVDISLVAGGESTVTVTSEQALEQQTVRDASDEAGYDLHGASR